MDSGTTLNDQEPPGYPCQLDRLVSPFVPFYDRDGITIYNADCRQVLPFLDRFDLLLTDPPYGIDVTKNETLGGGGATANGFRKWPNNRWDSVPQPDAVRDAISQCDKSVVWGGNYYELPPARGIGLDEL
jgi:hypothetical protein